LLAKGILFKGISKTSYILLQLEKGRDEVNKKIVFRDALKIDFYFIVHADSSAHVLLASTAPLSVNRFFKGNLYSLTLNPPEKNENKKGTYKSEGWVVQNPIYTNKNFFPVPLERYLRTVGERQVPILRDSFYATTNNPNTKQNIWKNFCSAILTKSPWG